MNMGLTLKDMFETISQNVKKELGSKMKTMMMNKSRRMHYAYRFGMIVERI